MRKLKNTLKRLIKKIPLAFTQNQRYDLLTQKIIKAHLQPSANCIDVGTHKGEIFDFF